MHNNAQMRPQFCEAFSSTVVLSLYQNKCEKESNLNVHKIPDNATMARSYLFICVRGKWLIIG